ncbi:MAG: glycosyltransferase [bacterium]|nr:glycosyltransferase [bacterium]
MKVSIVIPSYNQSEKLLKNLKEKILPFFDASGVTYSILIEADRSSKEQIALLQEGLLSLPGQVKLDRVEDKKGKGWAVKKGILHSEGDYVLFFDADLSTDLSVFTLMKKDLGKFDALVASRDAEGSVYSKKQPFKRRLTHWGAKTLIRWMFRIKEVHDTQCGFKAFRLPVAKAMVEKQLTMGSAFDVEYLYFLHLNGYSIQEYPAIWEDDPDSTLQGVVSSSKRFYKDLRAIKKNKKHYLEKEGEHVD